MEEVEGSKRGSKYFLQDDFIYYVKGKHNNSQYLKCVERSCPGRGILKGSFQLKNSHTHAKQTVECEKLRFKEKLLKAASQSNAPLKKIYNDVAENHRNAAIGYSYLSAESRMRRKRREVQPPLPQDLCMLNDFLVSRDWEHLGQTRTDPPQPFFRCLLQTPNGSGILVFVSPEVFQHLNISKGFHMDGTFQVVPRGLAYQLTTIHTVYQNKVYAAVYAVMTSKTKESYVTLLTFIKSVFEHMRPEMSMCDFETAQREAILQVFPGIQTKGCWFHFAQAIWKKHRSLGLYEVCRRNDEARKILRNFTSLALLPEEKINEGMSYLQEKITIANLDLEFRDFLSYISNYWLRQVGSSTFSVHGCSRRTNNDVESFHNQLFNLSGKQPHPSVWDFIRILVDMDMDVSLKFLTHQNGGRYNNKQKSAFKDQNDRIRNAETNLGSGAYTVGEFLECVSYSVDNLESSLRFRMSSLPILEDNNN